MGYIYFFKLHFWDWGYLFYVQILIPRQIALQLISRVEIIQMTYDLQTIVSL